MMPWDLSTLRRTPRVHPTRECHVRGLRTLYYEGLQYKGRPTWVFAYYAVPPATPPAGGWPAVVCVHGGGGTAYPEWVQEWTRRGYAALAMDLEGHLPRGEYPERPWHRNAGPSRVMAFADIDLAHREQWYYHAVADVALAGSLLRASPEIAPHRIGVNGISWGAVVSAAVSGVDPRWAFAVHVYGCGFLHESQADCFRTSFQAMSSESLEAYRTTWDPSVYLPRATMPSLWMNGTNDGAFPMDVWLKSVRASGGPATLCMPLRMAHGHGEAGWGRREIYAFADSVVNGGVALPEVERITRRGGRARATVRSATPVVGGVVCSTADSGDWQRREWHSSEARLDRGVISADVPKGSTAVFFSVTDERRLMVSSEHLALTEGTTGRRQPRGRRKRS